MALIYVIRAAGQCHVIGLSSDTKPAVETSDGWSFAETDTGKSYLCDGELWNETTATGAAAWGGISGTLSNQSDLQVSLDAKGTSNFSGAYAALSGLPTLGTAAATAIGNYATAAQGALAASALQSNQAITLTGDVTGTGNGSFAATIGAGKVTDAMRVQTSAATSATTGTMTVNMTSDIVTITPTGACTFNASGGRVGRIITFSVTTSGTSSFVLTFGTNFRKIGTLATGTVSARFFAVTFRCLANATTWQEIGRTAVQT